MSRGLKWHKPEDTIFIPSDEPPLRILRLTLRRFLQFARIAQKSLFRSRELLNHRFSNIVVFFLAGSMVISPLRQGLHVYKQSLTPLTINQQYKVTSVVNAQLTLDPTSFLSVVGPHLAVNPKLSSPVSTSTIVPAQYTVKKGDTISGIATSFNLQLGTLLAVNTDLQSNAFVMTGQTLTIPAKDVSEKEGEAAVEIRQKNLSSVAYAAEKTIVPVQPIALVAANSSYSSPAKWHLTQQPLPYYKEISQYFNALTHQGIDLATDIGTPVMAVEDGTISLAAYGWGGGYGNNIVLNHADGTYSSRYAHLSKLLVQVGEIVKSGQIIGYSGSSGRSTGPHLHFEIRVNGIPINPFQ